MTDDILPEWAPVVRKDQLLMWAKNSRKCIDSRRSTAETRYLHGYNQALTDMISAFNLKSE